MAKSNSFFNIDMLVLSLLKVKDCYGYELVKLIKEISNGSLDIKEGTLYPVVHNLLKKELTAYLLLPGKIYNLSGIRSIILPPQDLNLSALPSVPIT